jgi:YD repeat-containing protein
VYYDTFGDAVASQDVAGNGSFKAYDALGRVRYEVDAMGYVTGYTRNAFGEVTELKRYADARVTGYSVTQAPSLAQIEDAIGPVDHAHDRAVETEYDEMGRAVKVTQPSGWVFNGDGKSYQASAVMRNTYDAFGQCVKTEALADKGATDAGDVWAVTTRYFDERGQGTATVDAKGYVTTREYDAAGNVVRTTEYANASPSWSTAGLELPPASTDAAVGFDRTVRSTYDQANRKTSDTRVGILYSTGGDNVRGDVTTEFGYDAVGNLTRTTQYLNDGTMATAYSYYDALGRTTAVVAPSRTDTADGESLTPVTVYKRDAYGNVVEQIVRANGVASASESQYVLGAESALDRRTISVFDAYGRATQTTNAKGWSQYASYDAAGRLAKQWQTIKSDDGVLNASKKHTLYTVFEYDKLGRQTGMLTPASTSVVSNDKVIIVGQAEVGSVRTTMGYNAFGEMVARATAGNGAPRDNAEWFEYDDAGHLWRTNTGDGNVKVYLYDLLGRKTSTITSAGSVSTGGPGLNLGDGAAITSAAQVDQTDASLLRRTDCKLDLLGRVEKETLPTRRSPWTNTAEVGDEPSDLHSDYRPVVVETFDRWGNALTQTDVRNAEWVTTYLYNANNQVIEERQPSISVPLSGLDGGTYTIPITQIRYDALGRQVGMRDANGNASGQTWDAAGQLVQELHADGGVITHAYDAFGDQVKLTDALQDVTLYDYDNLGMNTAITTAPVQLASVDTDFNVSTSNHGQSLTTARTYDEAGHRVSETNALGEKTYYTYDLRGNLVDKRQPMGEETRAAFDASGKKIADEDGNGNLTTWEYDGFGLLREHTDFYIAPSTDPLKIQTAVPGKRVTSRLVYDNARQLIQQTNDRGTAMGKVVEDEDLKYGYDAAGQLIQIVDGADDKVTHYAYNAAGKHVWEYTKQSGVSGAAGAPVVQDQTIAYDSLGRVARVTGLDGVDVQDEYDAVGNRLHQSIQYNVDTGQRKQDLWYAYDEMNQETTVDGDKNGDILNSQGHFLTYDENGNRKSDEFWGRQVTSDGASSRAGWVTENYEYDAMDRLVSTKIDTFDSKFNVIGTKTLQIREYDGASRVVKAGPDGALSDEWVKTYTKDSSNTATQNTEISIYDQDGRLIGQRTVDKDRKFVSELQYAADSTWVVQQKERVQKRDSEGNLEYDYRGGPVWSVVYGGDGDLAYDTYDGWAKPIMVDVPNPDGTPSGYKTQGRWEVAPVPYAVEGGYDLAGNVKAYRLKSADGTISFYSYSQLEYDGYRQASGTLYLNGDKSNPGVTNSLYDSTGALVRVQDVAKPENDRTFVNDANGHVLLKSQVDKDGVTRYLRQLVVDGKVTAVYGQGTDPVKPTNDDQTPKFNYNQGDFDLNFQPISKSYPAPSAGQYQVQAGDTLQDIARQAYGDASLWYLIANANGLSGNEDLRIGETLIIPTRVGGAHNSSETFKPYDPSKVVGDTTPNLPAPKSDDGGCSFLNVVLAVIVIAVTIVVTVYTAGVGAAMFGADAGILSGFGTTMAAGAGVLAGGSTMAGVAGVVGGLGAAVLGATVGATIGQALSVAVGLQKEIDWGAIALGAFSGGVGFGLGAAASAIPAVSSLTGVASYLTAGAKAAVSNALTQQVGVWLGMRDEFRWSDVAIAGAGGFVAAGMTDAANQAIGTAPGAAGFGQNLAVGTVAGIVSSTTMAAMRGGRIDAVSIGTDAFGSALGNAIVQNASPAQGQQDAALEQQGSTQPGGQSPSAKESTSAPAGVAGDLRATQVEAPEAVDEGVQDTQRSYTGKKNDGGLLVGGKLNPDDPVAGYGYLIASGQTTRDSASNRWWITPGTDYTFDPSTVSDDEMAAYRELGHRALVQEQAVDQARSAAADARAAASAREAAVLAEEENAKMVAEETAALAEGSASPQEARQPTFADMRNQVSDELARMVEGAKKFSQSGYTSSIESSSNAIEAGFWRVGRAFDTALWGLAQTGVGLEKLGTQLANASDYVSAHPLEALNEAIETVTPLVNKAVDVATQAAKDPFAAQLAVDDWEKEHIALPAARYLQNTSNAQIAEDVLSQGIQFAATVGITKGVGLAGKGVGAAEEFLGGVLDGLETSSAEGAAGVRLGAAMDEALTISRMGEDLESAASKVPGVGSDAAAARNTLAKLDEMAVVREQAEVEAAARKAYGLGYQRIVNRIPGTILNEADAMNPGALGDNMAGTFSGGRYATMQLDKPLTAYRAWTPGSAREFGAFWTLDEPAGSLQTRIDSALLPEWGHVKDTAWTAQAQYYTAISVPKGTVIHVGEIGAQGGAWSGGGSQFLIDGGPNPAWKIGEGALQ